MLTQLFLKLTFVGAEWVMCILLLLSIISIALMVERWMYFFRTRIDSDELAARLDEQLRARNLQGAWQLVKDNHTFAIESAVVAAGLIALRNGAQAAAEAMLSVKARMRPALDANLSILATIGWVLLIALGGIDEGSGGSPGEVRSAVALMVGR